MLGYILNQAKVEMGERKAELKQRSESYKANHDLPLVLLAKFTKMLGLLLRLMSGNCQKKDK